MLDAGGREMLCLQEQLVLPRRAKGVSEAAVVPQLNAVLKSFCPLRYTLEVTVAPMPPSTNHGEPPRAKR